MQGRIGFLFLAFTLSACGSKSILSPDCHSCTSEPQAWQDFGWKELSGKWKGSVETATSAKGQKKSKKEEKVQIRFLTTQEFFKAHEIEGCGNLPAESVVLNGVMWPSEKTEKVYDAFVPAEEDKVAFARIQVEKLNGKSQCSFRKHGGVLGKNRLDLPVISFSDRGAGVGRGLASLESPEKDVSVEFLRFAAKDAKPSKFDSASRMPASAHEKGRPPLMIRTSQLSKVEKESGDEWLGNEEKIYRLWRE